MYLTVSPVARKKSKIIVGLVSEKRDSSRIKSFE